jgi:hypothetical protein
MNRYLFYIVVSSLGLALIANDVEDHLQFHFGSGLTSGLDRESYWYPDGSRKYDEFGNRKLIFGRTGWKPIDYIQEMPAWCYDGWHLMKVFRQFLTGLVLWAWGYFWYNDRRKILRIDEPIINGAVFMTIYGLLVYIFHAIFFDGVFK